MPSPTKTMAEPQTKAAPAPALTQQPALPEKQSGPVRPGLLQRAAAGVLPPPNGSPPAARAAELLATPEPGGAAGRSRMMRAMQGTVGNDRAGRMLAPEQSTTPPSLTTQPNILRCPIQRQCPLGGKVGPNDMCAGCQIRLAAIQRQTAGPLETDSVPSPIAPTQRANGRQILDHPRRPIQRKCACGGEAGPDGECAECKAKRAAVQRQVAGPTEAESIPSSITMAQPLSGGQPFDHPRHPIQDKCASGGEAGPGGTCAEHTGSEHTAGHASGSTFRQADLLSRLQRNYGNSYVSQGPRNLQPKLTVGAPNDRYEQEADQVAETVMRMPASALQRPSDNRLLRPQITPLVQRQVENTEEEPESLQPKLLSQDEPTIQRQAESTEEEEPLQTKPLSSQLTSLVQRQIENEKEEEEEALQPKPIASEGSRVALGLHRQTDSEEEEQKEEESLQAKGSPGQTMTTPPALADRIKTSQGSGQPLPEATRLFFEERFGYEFRQVRLHTDTESAQFNRMLNAQAFTMGRDIYFGPGRYRQDTPAGQTLLAHELTHVVQQGASAPQPAVPANLPQPKIESRTTASSKGPEPPMRNVTASARRHEQPGERPTVPTMAAPPIPRAEGPTLVPEGEAVRSPETAIAEHRAGVAPSSGSPLTMPERRGAEPVQAAEVAAPSPSAPAPPVSAAGLNRETGGVGPATTSGSFSGRLSQMVAQLRQMSPLRVPMALAQLGNNAKAALGTRRSEYRANPPNAEIHSRPSASGRSGGRGTKPVPVQHPRGATLPPLQTTAPPTARSQSHQHTGPTPEMRGVENPTRQLDQFEQQGQQNFFDLVRSWLRRLIGATPTHDSGLNTDPGPALTVDLSGAANPTQVDHLQGSSDAQVETAQSEADLQTSEDFGEEDVMPQVPDERETVPLPEVRELNLPECRLEKRTQSLRFDPRDEADLSQRVRATQADDYTAAEERLDGAETERDENINEAEFEADQSIETAHESSYQQQSEARSSTHADIEQQRQAWRDANQEALDEYSQAAEEMGNEVEGEIEGQRQVEDQVINQRYGQARQEAQAEQRRVEGRAEELQRQTQRESETWYSHTMRWIKQAVQQTFRSLVERIRQMFNELRNWVRRKFEELKMWAVARIEQARQWVINRLEQFRQRLKGLVDRCLDRFPGIANFFKRRIDVLIDRAQQAVNQFAESLKERVRRILDRLSQLIDAALRVVEMLLLSILSFLCNLALIGINLFLAIVMNDLDALIALIRSLPEPGFLGPWWPLLKECWIGQLEYMRDNPAEVMRVIRKMRQLITSPAYYAGLLLGVLKGLIWDPIVGILQMLWDIITGIPEAIQGLYNFVRNLVSDIEAIEDMITAIGGVADELRAFLGRPDAVEQIIAFIRRSPEILADMARRAFQAARGFVRQACSAAVAAIFGFVTGQSHFSIGLKIGSVIGQIIFEVLLQVALVYFTGGIGNAIRAGGRLAQALMKGVQLLRRGIQWGGRLILTTLRRLVGVLRGTLRFAQRVSGVLGRVVSRLRYLLEQVLEWFRQAFRRLFGRHEPDNPAELARKRRLVRDAVEDAERMAGRGRSVWWLRLRLWFKWLPRGVRVSIRRLPSGMWLVRARSNPTATTLLHPVDIYTVGPYWILRSQIPGTEAHHIIQHAWARRKNLDQFGYTYSGAPAIILKLGAAATPTGPATGHRATFRIQHITNRPLGFNTSFNQEWSTVSHPALTAAGVPSGHRRTARAFTYGYFVGWLRLDPNSHPPHQR